MKSIYFTICCVMSLTLLNGQSGIIEYTEAVVLKLEMDGMDEELKKMIPPSQTSDKILYFSNGESLYKNKGEAEDLTISHEEDGDEMELNFQMPESLIYLNLNKDEYVHALEFLGKDFLIIDKPSEVKWKITGEQKKVLDYVCQRAELVDTSRNVIAWFTPKLPVKIGPEGFTGLPGMILAIEIDGGDRKIVASNVDLATFDESLISKPKKGKKLSRSEYEKVRAEKLKEMGATEGGSGMKMIIMEERN